MPYKTRKDRLASSRRWYAKRRQRNAEVIGKRRDKQRKAISKRIEESKRDRTCLRCPYAVWQVLEFHHRDPAMKEFEIGSALRMCVSLKRLDAEIVKCDLICPNCHKEEHYFE